MKILNPREIGLEVLGSLAPLARDTHGLQRGATDRATDASATAERAANYGSPRTSFLIQDFLVSI